MSIQQGLTLSFKQQMLQAGQNLASDTLKIALYTAYASLNNSTTVYTTSNEIVGTGYTAGGIVLTGVTIQSDSNTNTVYVDFASPSWTNASFTTRGALIYNASKANTSVAILDFGSDKTVLNQTFTITMPTNTASTALIRFP
jgi:hypothetical protein